MFKPFRKSTITSHPDVFFKTDHLEKGLKEKSVKGGVATLASQGFKFFLQMGATAVLARSLSPEDYGLIGMTTVVTSFIELFKDMGLSEATIQYKEINNRQVSTLFWLNCLVGISFAVLIIFISPAVADFYNEQRIIGIMRALSINFIISSMAVQHSALLKRQMQLTVLAKVNTLSMIVGVVTAILSSWQGLGYWSLVLMFIATVTTNSLCIILVCPWRPGLPDFKSGIGPMLSVGGNLVGFNVLNYFSRNLDNILIGRVWGPQELGLYTKAYQLVLLPIKQINGPATNVAMPVLSRLQDDPEKYKRYYYKAISLIGMISMPIICFLCVAANDVILFVLGEQWLDTIPLFRLLMPAALVGTIDVAVGWAFRSLGKTGARLKLGIISSTIDGIAFILAIRWGAIGVAAVYGLTRPFVMLLNIFYCYRGSFLKISDLLRTLAAPGINSLISAIMLFICLQFIPLTLHIFIRLLIQVFLYFMFYLLMWLVTEVNRNTLREYISLLISIKKTKSE